MKFILAFAIIAVVLTVVFGAPEPWNEYKTKHGKKYGASEDGQRKKNFLATDDIIKKHNSQKNVTYQLGHTEFSDWTPKQLSTLQGAVKPANVTRSLESMETFDVETRQVPTSFDYRGNACLAPVRNQQGTAACGYSWAFASITPLEFARCKKYGSLLEFSEQQLVDCTTTNMGCNGGWYTNAWDYLKNAGGSARRGLYPYTGTKNTCKFTSSMVGVKITSYGFILGNRPDVMQSALRTYGPLAVAITVTNSFYSYKSGVYNDVACDNKAVNHAMVVVGWGTLSGIPYWIVRNSWGSGFGWGQGGYAFIQRGVNKCQIEKFPAVVNSVV